MNFEENFKNVDLIHGSKTDALTFNSAVRFAKLRTLFLDLENCKNQDVNFFIKDEIKSNLETLKQNISSLEELIFVETLEEE